jgi:hypothetical protein
VDCVTVPACAAWRRSRKKCVEGETGKGTDALDRRRQLAPALAAAKAARCSVVFPSWTGFRAMWPFVSGLIARRVTRPFRCGRAFGRAPCDARRRRSSSRSHARARLRRYCAARAHRTGRRAWRVGGPRDDRVRQPAVHGSRACDSTPARLFRELACRTRATSGNVCPDRRLRRR